jgi:hypothetical protein
LEQSLAFVLSYLEMTQGGENVVRKITLMWVTDMALCIAPDLLHKMAVSW